MTIDPETGTVVIEGTVTTAGGNATPQQYTEPSGESSGFKAPGGTVRRSIRDRIAQHRPYESVIVPIEKWGIDIEIRSLSLGARNDMLKRMREVTDGLEEDEAKGIDMSVLYPEIIIASCFDPETGERVFLDHDAEFINEYPAGIIDELAKPAMDMSGMGDTKKENDAEGKESSKTETSDSASNSHSDSVGPSES